MGEIRWRKSSRSSDQGGQCVEVARFSAERSAADALPLDGSVQVIADLVGK